MIRVAAILQLVWAIGMLALMGLPSSPWFKADSFWPYTATIFLMAAIGAFCNLRIGWFVAIGLNLLVLILLGGMVIVNVLMFVFGHELYQDSPGTIIVVFVYACIFVVPPALICGLLYSDRSTGRPSGRGHVPASANEDEYGARVVFRPR